MSAPSLNALQHRIQQSLDEFPRNALGRLIDQGEL